MAVLRSTGFHIRMIKGNYSFFKDIKGNEKNSKYLESLQVITPCPIAPCTPFLKDLTNSTLTVVRFSAFSTFTVDNNKLHTEPLSHVRVRQIPRFPDHVITYFPASPQPSLETCMVHGERGLSV